LFFLRAVVAIVALFLVALGVAYLVTRNRRYLTIAWRTVYAVVVLLVAFGLLYVFERVLLMV
jgi:hypothetical protein